MKDGASEHFKGFSKLNRKERLSRLVEMGALAPEDVLFLNKGGINDFKLAENFIENVIGYFQLPLGVATNLHIDGKDFVVPMAVEETSIIAAVSKTARWIREKGQITTEILGNIVIGQIQIAHVKDFSKLEKIISVKKEYFIKIANENVAQGLVARGGGVTDITLRKISRKDSDEDSNVDENMAVIHVLMDPVDCMGANIVNQVCEYLKGALEELSGEKVTMCILSNLVDTKLTKAEVVLNNIDVVLGEAIEEASFFAEKDPYRAATNNKGVLNGIDPVLIATGNDWRAVEAGVHAYACQEGQYRSITKWTFTKDKEVPGSSSVVTTGKLVGTIVAPLIVGTVGGVTNLHPTAKMSLKMLEVNKASDLSRVLAAVGLVQNLGALRALTTEGIIEGHMKLHIKNLSLGAGANDSEMPLLQRKLEELLSIRKRISLANAIDLLRELRSRADQTAQSFSPKPESKVTENTAGL